MTVGEPLERKCKNLMCCCTGACLQPPNSANVPKEILSWPYKTHRNDQVMQKLVEALELLLEAKHIKDTFGKGPAYEQLKERGWKEAREALSLIKE